jgi:hypothetical protein
VDIDIKHELSASELSASAVAGTRPFAHAPTLLSVAHAPTHIITRPYSSPSCAGEGAEGMGGAILASILYGSFASRPCDTASRRLGCTHGV